MAKKHVDVGNAEVSVKRCPSRSMMNLHHEHGNGEFDFGKVRFTQHINGACFWMSVDRGTVGEPLLYQLSTEELMNAMLNVVAQDVSTLNGG